GAWPRSTRRVLQLRQTGLDDLHAVVHLDIGGGQRHQDADDVGILAAGQQQQTALPGADHQPAGQFGVGMAVRGEEFEGDHGAQTPYLGDARILLRQSLQSLHQHVPQGARPGQQVLFLEDLQYRQCRGTGHRVAGVGTAQAAGGDGVHDFGPAAYPGQREAAGHRLGEGGQVGGNAHLLHGEEAAGTTGAGLHLVGDQQDTVHITECPQALHELRRGDAEATHALHRLDHQGGDIPGFGVGLEDLFDAGDGVIFADSGTAAYFISDHTYPRAAVSTSNEHEMFFFNLDVLGYDFSLAYIESIVAHEFQHMIRSNLQVNEEYWVNEGFSMFTQL